MTTSSDREPTLADVLREITEQSHQVNQELTQIKQNVAQNTQGLARIQQELERTQKWQEKDLEQARKWEDRTWDVIKWVGGISAGLSISAAIALVGLIIRYAIAGRSI